VFGSASDRIWRRGCAGGAPITRSDFETAASRFVRLLVCCGWTSQAELVRRAWWSCLTGLIHRINTLA